MNRPNILFIHVDQMHWQAMSACGNPYVKTPSLDRMAADGCAFRAAYAAMPQCCPARELVHRTYVQRARRAG